MNFHTLQAIFHTTCFSDSRCLVVCGFAPLAVKRFLPQQSWHQSFMCRWKQRPRRSQSFLWRPNDCQQLFLHLMSTGEGCHWHYKSSSGNKKSAAASVLESLPENQKFVHLPDELWSVSSFDHSWSKLVWVLFFKSLTSQSQCTHNSVAKTVMMRQKIVLLPSSAL